MVELVTVTVVLALPPIEMPAVDPVLEVMCEFTMLQDDWMAMPVG